MLRMPLTLSAFLLLSAPAWAANIHLNPGEKYRINRTTVYCDAGTQQVRRWFCACFVGFAQIGGVSVYANTVREADQLGLPKCQAERAADVNRVECYEDTH